MLDVHPPEHTPHSWRDFFIHIATIVVGLVIAIGLEQSVEAIHHHHEVKATREALAHEREENRRGFALNTASFRLLGARMENNLRVLTYLQQHPGTPEEKLPGVLSWGGTDESIADSVWKGAQQTQVLSLMPRKEVEEDANLYNDLNRADAERNVWFAAQIRALGYASTDPDPSHMTPAQIDTTIELTKAVLQSDIRWGLLLRNTYQDFPEFAPAPTIQETLAMMGIVRSAADQKNLAAAQAVTDANLKSLRDAQTAADKAIADTH